MVSPSLNGVLFGSCFFSRTGLWSRLIAVGSSTPAAHGHHLPAIETSISCHSLPIVKNCCGNLSAHSFSLYPHFPETCTQWFLISVVPQSTAWPHHLFLLIFLVSFFWSQSPPEHRPHQAWRSLSPLYHFPGELFFTVAFSLTATFDNQMWSILSLESAQGEILFYLPEH